MRIAILGALGGAALGAGAPAAAQAPSPLFAGEEPIHLVIQAPLTGLIHNRDSDAQVSGTITDPAGQTLPVTLALRGITRRMSDTCDFPPLRVDFASPPASSLFAGQKRLKLITHCRGSASFQQYLLLEYGAYKMYNVLTPRSFRVRLANIDYRDANGRPIISRVGYFLESLKDVARRNGLPETHAPDHIPVSDLSPMDSARYALFQHMIGNHDWSMRAGPAGKDCCHNAELIGPLAPGMTIPVPYDFDFSGMVSAPYATPPDVLHISDVRQRVFRGYCNHNAQTMSVAAQMRASHAAMLAALGAVPGLEDKTRQRASNYLEGFFRDIATDSDVNTKVIARCVVGAD